MPRENTSINNQRLREKRGSSGLVRLSFWGGLCSLCLVAALVLSTAPAAASDEFENPLTADVSAATISTREIDRALLLELVKLSRFNVLFHLEANRYQRWRYWTYPLGREAGTAVSFSGTLIDLKEQAMNLNNPRGINRRAVENGIACQITGNALSGTASGLELAQNTWVMWQARKKGYSPSASLAFVKDSVAKIDALIHERQVLTIKETSVPHRQVRDLENRLLKRIREQLVYEFRTWSCHSRDQAWRENTFFTVDMLQSYLRMTSSIIARQALDEPDLARGSLVCALISTSAATVNPLFRNLVGYTVRKHQERKLAKELPCARTVMPPGMSAYELKELHANHPDEKLQQDLLAHAVLLSERSERLDVNLDREIQDISRYRQVAQQQTISGPLIGATGLTSAILSSVAFFGYRQEPSQALKIGFPGRITSLTGQSYALLNTPYTVFSGMRRNRKLRQRGEHPAQILEERLRNLDRFEAQVRAAP